MLVTIQQALEEKGANPDELTAILGLLHADGYSADHPADEVFGLLDAEDYKEDLKGAQGSVAGVLQVCMS